MLSATNLLSTLGLTVVYAVKVNTVYLFPGYVQGMSDLLSPILVVMENEVDAFWCFAGLMERMVRNSCEVGMKINLSFFHIRTS